MVTVVFPFLPSNLKAKASNLRAKASNLRAMASNLIAMASTSKCLQSSCSQVSLWDLQDQRPVGSPARLSQLDYFFRKVGLDPGKHHMLSQSIE